VGLISSIGLIILSPAVWPGPDSEGSPFTLVNPALVSVPLGFLGCYLGTILGRAEPDDRYLELRVRADTGLGSERAELAERAEHAEPAGVGSP
jgi:cation/acetate symporter